MAKMKTIGILINSRGLKVLVINSFVTIIIYY